MLVCVRVDASSTYGHMNHNLQKDNDGDDGHFDDDDDDDDECGDHTRNQSDLTLDLYKFLIDIVMYINC